MAQHPWSALPNDPNKATWSYYGSLQISPIVSVDDLVNILHVPLLTKLSLRKYTQIIIYPPCTPP